MLRSRLLQSGLNRVATFLSGRKVEKSLRTSAGFFWVQADNLVELGEMGAQASLLSTEFGLCVQPQSAPSYIASCFQERSLEPELARRLMFANTQLRNIFSVEKKYFWLYRFGPVSKWPEPTLRRPPAWRNSSMPE